MFPVISSEELLGGAMAVCAVAMHLGSGIKMPVSKLPPFTVPVPA